MLVVFSPILTITQSLQSHPPVKQDSMSLSILFSPFFQPHRNLKRVLLTCLCISRHSGFSVLVHSYTMYLPYGEGVFFCLLRVFVCSACLFSFSFFAARACVRVFCFFCSACFYCSACSISWEAKKSTRSQKKPRPGRV